MAKQPNGRANSRSQPLLFFATPAQFRAWLEANHDKLTEQWVGFYRKASGKPSITWPESVDEALCFGWIDGIRKTVNAESYKIRFTPRRADSNWSAVNLRNIKRLIEQGRMHPAGLAAYRRRSRTSPPGYTYEAARPPALDHASEALFRRDKAAWDFWSNQPPGYKRLAASWVMSAKKPETRQRRLAKLIAHSAARRRAF